MLRKILHITGFLIITTGLLLITTGCLQFFIGLVLMVTVCLIVTKIIEKIMHSIADLIFKHKFPEIEKLVLQQNYKAALKKIYSIPVPKQLYRFNTYQEEQFAELEAECLIETGQKKKALYQIAKKISKQYKYNRNNALYNKWKALYKSCQPLKKKDFLCFTDLTIDPDIAKFLNFAIADGLPAPEGFKNKSE